MRLLLAALLTIAAEAAPQDCSRCHARETAAFAKSGMAQALEHAKDATLLLAHPRLTAQSGGYSYEIADGIYSVTSGTQTLTFPLTWAVGHGATGQTYMFQHEGTWFESRLSYFPALRALDLTMGAQTITPHTLLEAAGRALSKAETARCLNCHATGASTPVMIGGVQCERCHGAADDHVQAAKPMRKLSALSAQDQSDFCGQCHRTWADIAANGPRGILNVRFQPYRLANSKCFDGADARIRCTACHDPHRDVVTDVAAYDTKCLACHTSAAKPATMASQHICKVAARGCATCHMPRLELPGAHNKFTDHWIRVVRANERYPD